MYIFIKLFIFLPFIGVSDGLTQKITVDGRLLCIKVPLENVKIKLMEENILFDEMMSEGVTDNKGYFNISGEYIEYTKIEPYIEINYKCPESGEEAVEEKKFLYVPSNVFRYLGYTRNFKFKFDDIDLIRIKKRVVWYFF